MLNPDSIGNWSPTAAMPSNVVLLRPDGQSVPLALQP